MKPLVFILALYLEPLGTITEEPWDFVQGVETIEVIDLNEMEMKLRQRELQERFRILENMGAPNDR
ncbi:MAG: hypothetical protein CTY28_10265 [Hyphomicrobium sp.]|nr:MAG: hypothetical protein CTY28_10265 [Hyphomicrobium sp.]